MFSRSLFANALSCFDDLSIPSPHDKRPRRRSIHQTHFPPIQTATSSSEKEWITQRVESGLTSEPTHSHYRYKMEEHIKLPNGHLLNLQPRARNGNRNKVGDSERENDQPEANSTGTDQKPTAAKGTPPQTPLLRRGRPTKLPKPRAFTDKGKDLKESPAAKKQSIGSPAPYKRSPGASDRESPRSTDKDREHYWRKVRERFDKDSPAPRNNNKQKDYYHEAYQKIVSLASSPKQEITKVRQKRAGSASHEGNAPVQNVQPRIRVTNPNPDGQGSPSSSSRGGQKKYQSIKDQRNSESSSMNPQRSSEKADTITNSSIHSHPSISPISGPSSSLTEWEDRFVVNMPSAKEPNPPTMSAEQIVEFQKSIEKVYKEGESMLDPETLPSPRTTTPEDRLNPSGQEKQAGAFDGQDSRLDSSEADGQPNSGSSGQNRYYSPDEIGKQRFSTIWEESPSRQTRRILEMNPDGSFLGCREINGPNDKNPDEILYFSTTNERPRVVDVSAPMSKPKDWKKTAPTHQMTPTLEDKAVVQEEWKPISQNLKHAQCSRLSPKTMCREPPCQWPEKQELFPNPTGKENTKCSSSAPRQQDQKNSSGDDVFIITPTITRTMVSVADPRSAMYRRPGIQQPISRTTGEVIPGAKAKPQTNWTPSGLRRVTQNSWGKTKAPFPAPSRPTPVRNTPVIFQTRSEPGRVGVERRRAIRGYIRMPGMVKSRTENLGQRMHHAHPWQGAAASLPSKEELHPARSMSDSSQSFSSSIHDMSPTNSLTKDQRSVKEPVQSARIVEVAELDGLQVDDPKEDRKTENKDNCKSDNKAQTGCIRVEFTDRGAGRQKGGAVQHGTKAILDSVTFGLIMDILILSAAQAQALYTQVMDNRHSRVMVLRIALDCILRMVEHCLHVLKDILNAFSVYNSTGTWPRPSEKDLPRSLTDFCQALIYLVALGFIAMFLVRMVGYVVLVGYWVVWFTRPLGWALGGLGRALLP